MPTCLTPTRYGYGYMAFPLKNYGEYEFSFKICYSLLAKNFIIIDEIP
jgi:hypothetical protein